MNFIFVSTGDYPDTHAAAIRHSILSKGLVEQGHTVKFLVLTPQNWNGQSTISYEGIQFETLNTYKGGNKLMTNYALLQATFKARKIIREAYDKKNIDALVIFTIEVLPIHFLMKAAQALGIKVFHERTELPYALGKPSKKKQFLLNIYLNKLLPKFDGLFLISNKLMEYMKQFNANTKKLLTVVDLSFFSTSKPSPYPFPYVGYCGTISGNKDGVPILIEAFAKIASNFPGLKLVLVGNNSNKAAIKETLDAIASFGIEGKVVFSGLVDRDMMPVILCNAQILVVSKPDNEQNSGNFPIKIGEYLATGVPIVVTSVGEIPLFVKDGETGFLAKPGSAESFAAKMQEALSNPERSKAIGLNGKKIATEQFDYRLQASIMADYITAINKRK